MSSATKKGFCLCMIIGMLFKGHSLLAQDIAKAEPSKNYSSFHANAKPLKLGDKVPDLIFDNVLNYKEKKAKLSDFLGKLVILDMWSTSCRSCIASFSKMNKLQNEFNDKIQILLVDPHVSKYDSEERIKNTLTNLKKRTGFYPTLPIPIHDSILNTYFPHESVPHQIWIDGNGVVVAITGPSSANRVNIESVLSGKNIDIPLKDDWAYNEKKPLLVDGNGGASSDFTYRTIITGFKRDIGCKSGIRTNEENEIIGVFMLNKPLRFLINVGYPAISSYPESQVILDVKNPTRYKQTLELDTLSTYCYDLVIPPIKSDSFDCPKYLRDDLKRYFNISVHQQVQQLESIIIKVNKEKIVKSFSKYAQGIDIDKQTKKKFIHNYSISQILKVFSACFNEPLIDETGMSDKQIDVDFPDNFNLSDSHSVKILLERTGFILEEGDRNVKVIVISDN